jgi:hypothetical protein
VIAAGIIVSVAAIGMTAVVTEVVIAARAERLSVLLRADCSAMKSHVAETRPKVPSSAAL